MGSPAATPSSRTMCAASNCAAGRCSCRWCIR
jgi:hypothetical protein